MYIHMPMLQYFLHMCIKIILYDNVLNIIFNMLKTTLLEKLLFNGTNFWVLEIPSSGTAVMIINNLNSNDLSKFARNGMV